MEVKDIVDLDIVKTNMAAKTKDDALNDLANQLLRNGYISEVEGFIKDIYAREAEGQTGIGNYIAIPHGKSAYVNKVGVAIGINQEEIPWESLDGKGVKGIILFGGGNDNDGATNHLNYCRCLPEASNDEVVGNLLQAKKPEDVVEAFA